MNPIGWNIFWRKYPRNLKVTVLRMWNLWMLVIDRKFIRIRILTLIRELAANMSSMNRRLRSWNDWDRSLVSRLESSKNWSIVLNKKIHRIPLEKSNRTDNFIFLLKFLNLNNFTLLLYFINNRYPNKYLFVLKIR